MGSGVDLLIDFLLGGRDWSLDRRGDDRDNFVGLDGVSICLQNIRSTFTLVAGEAALDELAEAYFV